MPKWLEKQACDHEFNPLDKQDPGLNLDGTSSSCLNIMFYSVDAKQTLETVMQAR